MRSGKLRTRVIFQEETETPDGAGGKSITWGNDKVVFCEYMSVSAKETLAGGRNEATAMATLKARPQSITFLTESWTAVIKGVRWDIEGILPFGQTENRSDIMIKRGSAV